MELLIITGPPYSGKGTQCEILEKEKGLVHVSTGDLCRNEKNNKTELGVLISQYEANGDLVPDNVMRDLFAKALNDNKSAKGIILDGYPRTKRQVDDLMDASEKADISISSVLNIEVDKEELLKRALERAKNSEREDDKNPTTHIKRIEVFEKSTRPAIEYMKTKFSLENFDGMGTINEVTEKIKVALDR